MIENQLILALIGLGIGTLGTLIGVGGGFILVPILILFYPDLNTDYITAISLAVVAVNAIVGSLSYIRTGRVDFKAGIIFALATIPGSIIGVWATKFINRDKFDLIFGILLIVLAVFLFINGKNKSKKQKPINKNRGYIFRRLIDKSGVFFEYSYNVKSGILIALIVGFFSPIMGIGGGIIHVPAMSEWLHFPVHIATATSQFILAIMSLVSVVVHFFQGSYDNPVVINLLFPLIIGIIPGALLGAKLSTYIRGKYILWILSLSLAVIGIRILFSVFN